MIDTLLQIALPIYQALMAILIPLAVGYAVKKFGDWTGKEIEARHREALQSALENAARTAVVAAGVDAVKTVGMQNAKAYVRRSVPDAVKRFNIDDGMLERLLVPKLEQALK